MGITASGILHHAVHSAPSGQDHRLCVEADHLLISNLGDSVTRTVKGLVLVQAPPFTDFRYGDRVRTEGKLQTPTNTSDFDYREYLARQDVYSTPHLRWVQVSCHARA